MNAEYDASLVADGVVFDADDAALLAAIADHGSVSGAASALSRSRSRALGRLEALEGAFGPLVERSRGGAGGGGSRLTDNARAVLARFDRLRAALSGTAEAVETVLEGRVVDATGELGIVETDAGAVRALLVGPDGEPTTDLLDARVQVSLRADAVTLHDPTDAPPDGATSARNRFEGRVVERSSGEAVVRVAVEVGAATLVALVTTESVERLGLDPGVPVVASFKATATRATRTDA